MSDPRFNELVGDDLPPEEAARLRRVHDLLVEAGPPPELPPSLAHGPGKRKDKDATVSYLPRRRVGTALLIAAAIAALAFGGGYLTGHRSASFSSERSIPMHATNGSRAYASLQLGGRTTAGNWPIKMVVRGLPDLGKTGYYELYLTKGTKQLASCGTFVVGKAATTVQLNAPYLLPQSSKEGWVIVAHLAGHKETPTLLTT